MLLAIVLNILLVAAAVAAIIALVGLLVLLYAIGVGVRALFPKRVNLKVTRK